MSKIEVKINGVTTLVDVNKLEKTEDGLFAEHYNEDGTIDTITESKLKQEQTISAQINEANQYLSSTGWIWEKYNRNVLVLKDLTDEEFRLKYNDIINLQEESRLNINILELELEELTKGGN